LFELAKRKYSGKNVLKMAIQNSQKVLLVATKISFGCSFQRSAMAHPLYLLKRHKGLAQGCITFKIKE